jgi:hypothetical protein
LGSRKFRALILRGFARYPPSISRRGRALTARRRGSIHGRRVSACPQRHPRRHATSTPNSAGPLGTRTHAGRPANQPTSCRECASPAPPNGTFDAHDVDNSAGASWRLPVGPGTCDAVSALRDKRPDDVARPALPPPPRREDLATRAFSSEVDFGSREENAQKQKPRVPAWLSQDGL